MRIALVHSFYTSNLPSGENQVVMAQATALRRAGHEVLVLSRSTDDEVRSAGHWYPVRAAARVATGLGPNPLDRLGQFAPDVVHVHNLFPNIGSHWIKNSPYPLVATLHNFRPICASGILFRQGQSCFDCVESSPLQGLRHGCYKESRIATLPLTIRQLHHGQQGAGLDHYAAIIVLASRSETVYLAAGVPPAKIAVIPNFAPPARPATTDFDPNRWLFAGRIAPEKGLSELLDIWPDKLHLSVAGDGPQLTRLANRYASNSIDFLGLVDSSTIESKIRESCGVVIPSRCHEGLPTVLLEAASAGRPTVARVGNSAADEVDRLGIGATYHDSPATLRSALMHALEMAGDPQRIQSVFESEYSEGTWLARITALYDRVICAAR